MAGGNLVKTLEDHGEGMSAALKSPASSSPSITVMRGYKVRPRKESAYCAIVSHLFEEFRARRAGIVKALTTEVKEFYRLCDPEMGNLCLYGNIDETWEVRLPKSPADRSPSDIPDPSAGINFRRDKMDEKEWLAYVALHSDAWLLGVTYYLGSHLFISKESRTELFSMINRLPTVSAVVAESPMSPTKARTPDNNIKCMQQPSPH